MCEKCTTKPTKKQYNSQYKEKYPMNAGLTEACFPTYSLFSTKDNVPSVHLEHQRGCRTSEQRLPVSLEISRCRTDRLRSIQCLFLQVLDVTDFCSTNSRLQISTEIKLFRDLSQIKEQAALFVHFKLSIASETGCSRIPELQEENVWPTNMYEP
jgi:hypothetical protein